MQVQLVAQINLLPTEHGGRFTPLVSGEWRTVFGIGGEHWSARLQFSGNPAPGETFEAGVQFLVAEAVQHFPVGAHFTVWENGNKGEGRVLRVAA